MKKKPIFFGLAASALLLGLYFLVFSLLDSFSGAIANFQRLRYWFLILSAGFGVQVGLYFIVRAKTKIVAASGAVSAGSMVVCCLHHAVDILPFFGLAATALFLNKYQVLFLVIGIISNVIGIVIMLWAILRK